MFKITFLPVILSVCVLTYSCNKKKDDPQPAVIQTSSAPAPVIMTEQNYPNPVVRIALSVEVLPSSASLTRLEGLSGANVTVVQNGKTLKAETDESGVASFSNLLEGAVSIYIFKEGYLAVNTSTDLVYTGKPVVNGTNGNSGTGTVTVNNTQMSSSRVNITLPKLGTSVEGVLRGDIDGNRGGTSNILATGTVKLVIDNKYSPNIFTASVNNGIFLFTDLPENVNYTLITSDIFATEPADGNVPSYKYNLNFPGQTYTTPMSGNKAYLGIISLE